MKRLNSILYRKGIALLFAWVISCGMPSLSHAADSLTYSLSFGETLYNDISLFGEDISAYITSPLHFSGNDWAIAGSIAGGTAVMMSGDNWVNGRMKVASRSSALHTFMAGSKDYGEITVASTLMGAAYGVGLIFKDPWLRITGRELVEALAFSGMTTSLIKLAAGRSRPYRNMGNESFIPFAATGANTSFPSGHSTVAFAVSTILSERIHNVWASILLYAAAACTGFSRMYDNQHWLSDVFLGAAIGTTAGLFVSHRDETRENGVQAHGNELIIYPYLGGIQASYRF